ncbi:MAG TPA: small metal-binding protein SmbP [Nitrospiraceae bacterium]|nr:small metal-binding protein SmbP [Nitrospiraceae bacterium]
MARRYGPLKQYAITILMIFTTLLSACATHDPYIAAALEHADQAIINGGRKDNNALAEQATVALRYVYLAERNKNKDSRLQGAIRALKEAVNHARFGRSDAGVQAAEQAYRLLSEVQ